MTKEYPELPTSRITSSNVNKEPSNSSKMPESSFEPKLTASLENADTTSSYKESIAIFEHKVPVFDSVNEDSKEANK